MTDFFYKTFEQRHRGPRELIKTRLLAYLPFIQILVEAYPKSLALDIGCGRGEWLELVAEQGLSAKGVDLDEGMLEHCRKRGLHVENADALAYLKELPSESLSLVSGFHVAEHLPFDVLQQVVAETKRVLVPGGVLILETPNPENLTVGTNSFYLDPTHERPIPPQLLSFLPEFYGFQRSKILRLQESPQLKIEQKPTLMQVLNGVSPDYAVVAQKKGLPMLSEALDALFDQDFGLTLETLADRYHDALNLRLDLIQVKSDQIQVQLEKTLQDLHKLHQSNHHLWQIAEQRQQEIQGLLASTSWRITAPLRGVMNQWLLLRRHGPGARAKSLFKKVLRKPVMRAAASPRFALRIKRLADTLGVTERLQPFIRSILQQQGSTLSSQATDSSNKLRSRRSRLSSRAQQIYYDLKLAIADQHEGTN